MINLAKLLGTALLAVSLAAPAEEFSSAPVGTLVDIGTHRLHLQCQGTGSPTVIFESGLGGFSLEWSELQGQIAKTTRACVYDRAGYGWSDPGPMPRSAQTIASELHALLQAAHERGPFIIVAHSFGGYAAQIFARTYPTELAAMLLVDASSPDQLVTFPVHGGAACDYIDHGVAGLRFEVSPHLPIGYPSRYAPLALELMVRPAAVHTQVSELCNFGVSADQVHAAPKFPQIPLIVVSRGRAEFPDTARGRDLERAWAQYQEELSHLTTGALHLVAKNSGHHVHLDQARMIRELAVTSVLLARYDRNGFDPRRIVVLRE